MLGHVVLTEEDLRSGRVFPDAVALSAFPLDLHQTDHVTRLERVGTEDHTYCIPLWALIPADVDNAVIAGRGVFATHVALAALRVMPSAMAMGQAAGVAAAHASRAPLAIAQLPFDPIRRELLQAVRFCLPGGRTERLIEYASTVAEIGICRRRGPCRGLTDS